MPRPGSESRWTRPFRMSSRPYARRCSWPMTRTASNRPSWPCAASLTASRRRASCASVWAGPRTGSTMSPRPSRMPGSAMTRSWRHISILSTSTRWTGSAKTRPADRRTVELRVGTEPVELRRTPLHAAHAGAGARLVPFSGWEMPLQYSSIKEEQLAVRHAAGAFDVSHMGRYELAGPDAAAALQRILTNDVAALSRGRAAYSLICREDGGIVDDVIAYRRADDLYSVVVNAGNREKDWAWIQAHLEGGAELRDRSDDLALIAFQGPRAAELLEQPALRELPAFGFAENIDVLGIRCALVARTGYTGEDGFELMVPAEAATQLWERL